jgi:preprotein translocase subunit SecA
VALEDHLWRVFNANMMEHPALKMWPPMEEVNQGFLSRLIQKTQERIENHFFEQRKQTLEYDDVLNAQREHIYGLRREVLLGKDVRSELVEYVQSVVADTVENAWMIEEDGTKVYDHSVLFEDLSEIFPIVDYVSISDLEKYTPGPDLVSHTQQIASEAYKAKVEETGEEPMKFMEKQVLLRAVNDRWMDHLQTVEYIREGIGLRGYGQVDPLVAYKRETYDTFQTTLKQIRDQASKMIFHLRPNPNMFQENEDELLALTVNDDEFDANNMAPEDQQDRGVRTIAAKNQPLTPVDLQKIDWKKVGRNDLCPCGSGKKFKECHYRSLRSEGVI